MTSPHRPSASPRRPAEQPTSPTSPAGRNNRRSFSFTRNQDAALEAAGSHPVESPSSLISKFRATTLGSTSKSSDKIEEEDDDDEDDTPLPALAPKTRFSPGVALGNGTGVSEPARSVGKDAPSGLPLVPSLQPAGGNQRQVKPDNVASADVAYGDSSAVGDHSEDSEIRGTNRARGIVRTYSMAQQTRRPHLMNDDRIIRQRRLSHDALTESPRRFIVDVEETMRIVLEQEDTDGNFQICITDSGPKVLSLGTATSEGYKGFDIRGTYMLSNLLQELALAREHGRKRIVLDESRLTENPVDRLSRMISQTFWHNLTRRIDADGLEAILSDPKNRSKSKNPRIYVPAAETEMIDYYRRVASERPSLNLSVEVLPSKITAEYTRDLNDKPGLLALAMSKEKDPKTGEDTLRGIPFVVPGARFNELYNWDSYFISLGLVVDGWVDMTRGIVEHFIFNIKHYGKVLNGNRSYYLMRSQPPFLTDMALQVYSRLDPEKEEENKAWLKRAIQAAIKEYHTVWNAEPRRDPKTGLTRYRPEGLGVPPETEASHFTHILRPYAEKHGVSVNEFTRMYNHREVTEPELDEYFMHDRAVRESGHDTTYRFEKRCANLATIDLNSLMYKYEVDIATAIREVFDDELELEDDFLLLAPLPPNYAKQQPPKPSRSIEAPQKSAEWFSRAAYRKEQVDKYCWNEGMSLYYDYDTVKEEQSVYESVTAFWAMWAGLASEDQAARLVRNSLRKFEEAGGLVSCTRESVGKISLDRPNRQWDWPLGWAPHQILAWVGLERYGYSAEAARLAYRWLYQMTVTFVDYNGMVIEKIDVVQGDPFVEAEYGQQGIDFHYVPKEGFGWSNASYQIGLTFLTDPTMRRSLGLLQPPTEHFFRKSAPAGKMGK